MAMPTAMAYDANRKCVERGGHARETRIGSMHFIDPLYSISGFGVGFLVGMTGVGGGSLMTPLLILVFGIHPATAVGSDLLYAAVTKTGGSLVHGWARSIHWPVVGLLACGSPPGRIPPLPGLGGLYPQREGA